MSSEPSINGMPLTIQKLMQQLEHLKEFRHGVKRQRGEGDSTTANGAHCSEPPPTLSSSTGSAEALAPPSNMEIIVAIDAIFARFTEAVQLLADAKIIGGDDVVEEKQHYGSEDTVGCCASVSDDEVVSRRVGALSAATNALQEAILLVQRQILSKRRVCVKGELCACLGRDISDKERILSRMTASVAIAANTL